MISLKYPFLTLDFLREDTRVGTSFLRVAAHDDDYSSNAAITYSIANEEPDYLQINPTTGWVFVNRAISQVWHLLSFLSCLSQYIIRGTEVTSLCYPFTLKDQYVMFKLNMSLRLLADEFIDCQLHISKPCFQLESSSCTASENLFFPCH